jgi:hypothetical protein
MLPLLIVITAYLGQHGSCISDKGLAGITVRCRTNAIISADGNFHHLVDDTCSSCKIWIEQPEERLLSMTASLFSCFKTGPRPNGHYFRLAFQAVSDVMSDLAKVGSIPCFFISLSPDVLVLESADSVLATKDYCAKLLTRVLKIALPYQVDRMLICVTAQFFIPGLVHGGATTAYTNLFRAILLWKFSPG